MSQTAAKTEIVCVEWDASAEHVAAVVRRAREQAQVTQLQLAQRMQSTQSVVARWETGEHDMMVSTLARIADALGVSLVARFGPAEVRPDGRR